MADQLECAQSAAVLVYSIPAGTFLGTRGAERGKRRPGAFGTYAIKPATINAMFVWGSAQRGTPVQINVIGTAMFVIAVLLVLVSMLISNRRNKQKA